MKNEPLDLDKLLKVQEILNQCNVPKNASDVRVPQYQKMFSEMSAVEVAQFEAELASYGDAS